MIKGKTLTIGKIFYRARMRKSLDEAIRWLKKKGELAESKGLAAVTSVPTAVRKPTGTKKVFEIHVGKCKALRRGDKQF
jgi:hypothetical protein